MLKPKLKKQKTQTDNVRIFTDKAVALHWHKHKIQFCQQVTTANKKLVGKSKNTLQITKLLLKTRLSIRSLAFYFRNSPQSLLSALVDIAVVDRPGFLGRFQLNYVFFSAVYVNWFVLQIHSNEILTVPSLFPNFTLGEQFFEASNWLEREAWDMYGIYFGAHTDLRRILTDYGFAGHPLRRDFPLTGFSELYYDDAEGCIVWSRVELAQELRIFSF